MKKFHLQAKFWCGGKKILLIFLSIFLFAIATSVAAQVDDISPTGEITATPTAVRVDEIFNITVSGEDNIDMGILCYKEKNDINWACYNCFEAATSCSHTFKRSESALKKYKYYGQVRDAVENVSFTNPNYVVVTAQTNPRVATFSVDLQGTQATLNGYLTFMGGADSVDVWFEWGTTTIYGNKTAPIVVTSVGPFSAPIGNLSSGATYHFRAVAKNGVGTAYGDDMVTTELIKNSGFETGNLMGWTEFGTGDRKADTRNKHKGLYAGLIGYRDAPIIKDGKSAIYQDVIIPSVGAKVKFSLWYKFYTTDECPYDFINIYLKDTANTILKTYLKWCCEDCSGLNTHGWNRITDDLSAFAGQTVRIYFEVSNRFDAQHRSWAYIDGITINYIPTVPSSVSTKPATGIKTNEAVFNGELIDMGGADSVDVWFEWGTTTIYGNKTAPIVVTSVGPFSAPIGNLSSGATYHFRAVAKNAAGTSYGNNLEFTTEHSAAGGWILPVSHEDPAEYWSNEYRAYDNKIQTRARSNFSTTTEWHGFIIFDLAQPVKSNKIRVTATGKDCPLAPCPLADIDILYENAATWTDVFIGTLPLNHNWVEIALPFEGMVTEGRFRFKHQRDGTNHSLGEFQFYKVPDEPITPPAGITLEATSIEKNSAILHGMVIDDGRELCQVRFQYGTTTAYGINTPWKTGPGGVGWASGETFGKFISGLEKNVTYHFRTQIKNSAGIASGANRTFFTQSAPSGWVTPHAATGTEWEDVYFVFDDQLETYARRLRLYDEGQWSPSLYLQRPEIFSDKIRFWVHEPHEINNIQVDVLRDGNWINNVYNGAFTQGQWVEATFSAGRVSQARVKLHMTWANHWFYYVIQEFDFWKIAEKPSVLTLTIEPGDVGVNYAKMKGNLIDLGGAPSVDIWFVWDKNPHDNWQDYASSSADNKITKTQIGKFEYAITGLSPLTTYHFRAVASNVAGTTAGINKSFTTLGNCIPGATSTCISGQGCEHILVCPEAGYWHPCPRDECCKLKECLLPDGRSPHCPCPEPPAGYENPGHGYCAENCTCNIGTGKGEPCEPWPVNQPPAKPEPVGKTWQHCLFQELSIPTFNWTYFDPDGDPQSAYQIRIYGEATLDETVLCHHPPCLSFRPPNDWIGNNLIWGKTYNWQVRVQDNQDRWSAWSDLNSFTMPTHAYPWPAFTPLPTIGTVGQIITFINNSTCYGASCLYQWDFQNDGTWDLTQTTKQDATATYAQTDTKTVKLRITDNLGQTCETTREITIMARLPWWREIIPR